MRSLVIACFAVVVSAAVPARGHAILMDSQPEALATVAPGPTHFVLRFNSRIDRDRSRLELRRAGGKGDAGTTSVTAEAGPADTMATDIVLSAGAWVLRWQVLAVDGHITRGEVPFTVRTP